MDTLTMRVADIPVTLECTHGPTLQRLASDYAEFVEPRAAETFGVRVSVVDDARFLAVRPGAWRIETEIEGETLFYRSYTEAGWADLKRERGLVIVDQAADIENFLRVLYAHLCVRRGGLMLHASGVIRNSGAYVFFGASGSGKTTVTRLSPGCTILSDDLVILRRSGSDVRAYGVPFRGELREAPRANADASLRGLYSLAKDGEHRIEPVAAQEGVARLASCTPFVMADPDNVARVMGVAADIISAAPVEQLHFRKDGGFWGAIDEHDSGRTASAGRDARP